MLPVLENIITSGEAIKQAVMFNWSNSVFNPWRIRGRGQRSLAPPPPPIFLDQTEARKDQTRNPNQTVLALFLRENSPCLDQNQKD